LLSLLAFGASLSPAIAVTPAPNYQLSASADALDAQASQSVPLNLGWAHSSWSFEQGYAAGEPSGFLLSNGQDLYATSAVNTLRFRDSNLRTTFSMGNRDSISGGRSNILLLESAYTFGTHTVFARAEGALGNDRLPAGNFRALMLDIKQLQVGYAVDLRLPGNNIPLPGEVGFGVGGSVSNRVNISGMTKPVYSPNAYMLFARFRLR
jgi:hypothetical protein